MTKKDFKFYCIIILSLTIACFLTLGYLTNFIENNDEIIKVKDLIPRNKEKQSMFKVNDNNGSINTYKFNKLIDKKEFNRIKDDQYELILFRISANNIRVIFNDEVLDEIGENEKYNSNIWNSAFKIRIDKEDIKEVNTLSLEITSQWGVTKNIFPIIITKKSLADKIFNFIIVHYVNVYLIIIGVAISTALLLLLLLKFSKNIDNKKQFIFLQLANIFMAIYLLQYLTILDVKVSYLNFTKIVSTSLYISVLFYSLALYFRYKFKHIMIIALIPTLLLILGDMFIYNYRRYLIIYRILDGLLLINIFVLAHISFKNRKKSYEDKTIFITVLAAVVFSISDYIYLLLEYEPIIKLNVFGLVLVSIAITYVSISNFIQSHNAIYSQSVHYKNKKEEFEYIANKDSLTNLYNHRYFYDYIENIKNNNDKVHILFCDIDNFKKINDNIGHRGGDLILAKTAEIIRNTVSDKGIAFRYGGEEIVIIIENHNDYEVNNIAEDIRKSILECDSLNVLSKRLMVSISIGIAAYPKDSTDLLLLVEKADKAMYYAKYNGRNQVCHYNAKMKRTDNTLDNYNDEILDYISSLVKSIEAKDSYTAQHSESVAYYSSLLAEELELNNKEKYYIRLGALLHDCGKIGIPDNILNKPGIFTDEEYEQMKNHTVIGNNITKRLLKDNIIIQSCVRNHHERYDGFGYPDKLKGEDIPIYARIIGIVDAFDAIISKRSYKNSISKQKAIDILKQEKGKQFDPILVDKFINVIERIYKIEKTS